MVELIHKAVLDGSVVGAPTIVDTCPNRNSFLIASSSHVSIVDYQGNYTSQRLTSDSGDIIRSASLHASGQHVLIASKYKLQLANVLYDRIQPFWETGADCSDCQFNRRGTVFTAICSGSIVVYDFINGQKICSIACETGATNLGWGPNCSLHAICGESLLCKWDALDGTKLAEHALEDGNILSYTVSNYGKVHLTTSSNSIVTLNRDLKESGPAIDVDGKYDLTGAICVSDEGLIVVGMQSKDAPTSSLVRMYSPVGGEFFDQVVSGEAKDMNVCGQFLVTVNSIYEIKDSRGYSPYLTSCPDLSMSEELCTPADEPKEILVSTSYLETKDALRSDLNSRLIEKEVMNELQLRGIQQAQDEELRLLRESYDAKLSELGKRRAELLQQKQNLIQSNQTSIKETMSAQLSQIHQLEKKYKNEILAQATENLRIEATQKEEVEAMEKEREMLQNQHEKELADFRREAEHKLRKAREINEQLSKQRDLDARECKERISLLEDEIDESISLLAQQYDSEIAAEKELSQKLALESGILRRRIDNTAEKINSLRERVTSLLHKEEECRAIWQQKESERQRLADIKEKKEAELATKRDAVQKLVSINQTLVKTRELDKGSLNEAKDLLEGGPLPRKRENLRKEAEALRRSVEGQNLKNESMNEKVKELKAVLSSEQKKVLQIEGKARAYDSVMAKYLIKLEACNKIIQEPSKLRDAFSQLQELARTRHAQEGQISRSKPTAEADNQITFLFLQKMKELEELKAEDAALTRRFKEEKSEQIAANADLLKKVASRANGAGGVRRRSSMFKY